MLTQLTPETLESSAYPRTYRVSLGWRLFLLVFGILFGLGGSAGVGYLVFSFPHDRTGILWVTIFLGAIAAGFTGLGVYVALTALMYRLVLTSEDMELIEPFRSRQISRAEICGRRMLRTQQGVQTVVLVPKDAAAKTVKLSLILKTDRTFDAWIAQLPDLDQQDVHQSEQQIAETLYQDLMPQERAAKIANLKVLAKWVNRVALALTLGALFLPDYHHLAIGILIALPWIAIWLVARFQPLYRFGAKRNDAHPDMTLGLMTPGLILMVRALLDAHTLDWTGPLTLAVAGGLPLTCAALRVDPWFRRQGATAILTCIFTLAYGFGAGFEIDVLADSTKPSIYATQVLGKRISHGSKSTTYYLTVGPWGPISHDDEISVPAARYRATDMGDTICIYLGKGAFKVAWYQVRDCPAHPSDH